jgi:proton-translocating NADH-quinone oxidoreductase chain N
LAAGAFAVYLVARFLTHRNELLALFTAGIFAAALVALALLHSLVSVDRPLSWGRFGPGGAFLRADPGALVIAGVALGLGFLVAIYSGRYLALDQRYETYYPLLLLLEAGLVGMLFAADVFNLYMFCELMSVTAYTLVAFRRYTRTAIEAGFKYLVMGSVGTLTILMGISFIYRETGSTVLLYVGRAPGLWARVGMACLLVGFGLKCALVPLHTWLPDAHGRAPSSVSAMLSGVIVQSTFYALLKVSLGLGLPGRSLGTLLILLSLLNMMLGTALALVQTHTKRLLAYSTVAQMGYLMLTIGVGLRYGVPSAIQAGLFMVLAQAAMKGLAFLCKGACHFYLDATTIDQLRGTAVHMPLIAVALSVALAGLAGVPPLAGFASKWFILRGTLRSSDALGYVGLAVFLLNGLVSLGYYLPLIGILFVSDPNVKGSEATPSEVSRVRVSPWMALPIVALGGLVLAIGLYPNPWLTWTAGAASHLLGWVNEVHTLCPDLVGALER